MLVNEASIRKLIRIYKRLQPTNVQCVNGRPPSNLFEQLIPLIKCRLECKKLRNLCILSGSGTIKPAGHLCLSVLLVHCMS